ncbi:MAG: hypothetical protein EZS28_051965 [Streblomastix strix]|uniref:Uncharacterized protein n=1 Tax=Streblomastix strix TaxID=222440 RepID=A0A5J4SRC9_9EUKA|nr:MAG: hypothetical protein EZS28_051965 [Streblomastix strix]
MPKQKEPLKKISQINTEQEQIPDESYTSDDLFSQSLPSISSMIPLKVSAAQLVKQIENEKIFEKLKEQEQELNLKAKEDELKIKELKIQEEQLEKKKGKEQVQLIEKENEQIKDTIKEQEKMKQEIKLRQQQHDDLKFDNINHSQSRDHLRRDLGDDTLYTPYSSIGQDHTDVIKNARDEINKEQQIEMKNIDNKEEHQQNQSENNKDSDKQSDTTPIPRPKDLNLSEEHWQQFDGDVREGVVPYCL